MDGELVLLHLCRVASLGVVARPKRPEDLHFIEGQRSIVLSIMRFINKDPAQVMKVLQESMEREHETIT